MIGKEDGCCYDEVAHLVDLICIGSDSTTKESVTSVVAKECLKPPGMSQEELTVSILAEWNARR